MLSLAYLTAATYFVCAGPSELDLIARDIALVWRKDGPARNLRVECRFELVTEHPDEALSDRYFPNALIPGAKGPRPQYRAKPQSKWIEDVARRGEKYRNDHEFFHPDTGVTPRGWKVQKFFNGMTSWHYDEFKRMALQYRGAARTTQMTLGYYFDMIGFPGNPLGKDRTTSGGTDEPYQLDELIPSRRYWIDGDEVVDGLHCVILTRPGIDRLWLARHRGWAIVRREWRWSASGPLKRRMVNRDFREISPGAWIPFAALMEIYGHPSTRPGQRVGSLKANVVHAEADVPDDWFEPHFPKGALIEDTATGGRYPFGMELQELDKAVVRASSYGPMFRPIPWWRRPIWWGLAGALALLVFAAGRHWMGRRGVEA
jgi:hypothetical protein